MIDDKMKLVTFQEFNLANIQDYDQSSFPSLNDATTTSSMFTTPNHFLTLDSQTL